MYGWYFNQFSTECRIQNNSKNHNLYLYQSKITLPGLLWDTLYIRPNHYQCNDLRNLCMYQALQYFWYPPFFNLYQCGTPLPLRRSRLWMTPIDGPDFFKMMKEAGGPDWTSPIWWKTGMNFIIFFSYIQNFCGTNICENYLLNIFWSNVM